MAERLQAIYPEAEYFPLSGAIRVWRERTIHGKGSVAVVSAGTSDIPVAEEARLTAEVMGNTVDVIYDVGVAGIHRLLSHSDRLMAARENGEVLVEHGRGAGRGWMPFPAPWAGWFQLQ